MTCKDGCPECMQIELNENRDELDKIARYLIGLGVLKTDDMNDDEVSGYVIEVVAAKDAEIARLKKVMAAAESMSGFYYQTESEDGSDCYWVDRNYSIVSENDESRYAFLSSKQIADRRFQRALQEAQ